ncbi:hypothetical protein KA005_48385 [bacterium]|nr:hypothetical protein [bacterium]
MEPQTVATLGGGLIVMANVLLFWIREWKKHQTWKANGNDLKLIKDDVKSTNDKIEGIDDKVGETIVKIAEIKTAVNAQKSQCKQTVNRFDKAISDQNQQIINLTGRKR